MEIFKKALENGWFTNPATKKTRAFLLIIVVVLIVAIIVNPFKSETAQSVENQLESSIKKLENNSDAAETRKTPALFGSALRRACRQAFGKRIHLLHFHRAKIGHKKNVDGDGNKYTFELSGEQYGELAGKKYFYDGSDLYDTTKTSEKLENEQKNEILAKLMTYLPESFCPTKSFNRLIAFADKTPSK